MKQRMQDLELRPNDDALREHAPGVDDDVTLAGRASNGNNKVSKEEAEARHRQALLEAAAEARREQRELKQKIQALDAASAGTPVAEVGSTGEDSPTLTK